MRRAIALYGGFLGIVVTVCGCGGSAGHHMVNDSKPAQAARVTTVRAQRRTLERVCTQPGQILAFEEAPIVAKVAGYIARVTVDIGDKVHGPEPSHQGASAEHGQLLAEIAAPELKDDVAHKRALVAQAEARVEQAMAEISLAKAGVAASQARTREADAALERAQAELARAESEYHRLSQLSSEKVVTEELVEEARRGLAASQASAHEASAHIATVQALLLEAEAGVQKAISNERAAQAQLQLAQAELQRAQTMFDFTKLRAPFSGIVTVRNADVGHFVQPGPGRERPLFAIARIDRVRVNVEVPEAEAADVTVGDPARIAIAAIGNEPVLGQVTRTSGSLEQQTHTLRAQIELPNSDGKLRPGSYAQVTLVTEIAENAIVVPKAALFSVSNQTHCVVIRDGKSQRLVVRTGLETAGEVVILSGISENDEVVVSSPDQLSDQQVVDAQPAAGG